MLNVLFNKGSFQLLTHKIILEEYCVPNNLCLQMVVLGLINKVINEPIRNFLICQVWYTYKEFDLVIYIYIYL